MKNFRIESLILAIGLLLLGICIQKGFKSFAERDRSVNVKGLAEMEVPADKVTCLLYTSPSPRDRTRSRMPSSA